MTDQSIAHQAATHQQQLQLQIRQGSQAIVQHRQQIQQAQNDYAIQTQLQQGSNVLTKQIAHGLQQNQQAAPRYTLPDANFFLSRDTEVGKVGTVGFIFIINP